WPSGDAGGHGARERGVSGSTSILGNPHPREVLRYAWVGWAPQRLRVEAKPRAVELETHCAHGHRYTAANTVMRRNGRGEERRRCKTCEAEKTRRWKARRSG